MLYNILLIIQILVALGIIGLVLVQHGKGADAGAAFGSGASGSVFGSRGAGNFLSRSTAILAVVFFVNSMALAWLVANRTSTNAASITDAVSAPAAIEGSIVPADVPAAAGNDGSDVPAAGGEAAPAKAADVPAAAPAQDTAPADVPAADSTEKK